MHSQKPITIKDIASRFRCSPSTVSRALNDHPAINEETRKNIQEYAREKGYQRNELSVSLLNKRSNSIGIIVPTVSSYYESAIVEGIQSVLQPLGYTISICVTSEKNALEREHITKLLSNRVEAIFLSVAQETYDARYDAHIQAIVDRNVPLIFIDRDYEGLATHRVTVDDYQNAFSAVEHLIQQGCTKIAHLKGPQGLLVTNQRYQGYKDCLAHYGITYDASLVKTTNFTAESAFLPTIALLEQDLKPDGIFGSNDLVTIGAMRATLERGFRIPDDIAFVGFDNHPIAAYITPSLSTVSRPGRLVGIEAAQLFLDQRTETKPNEFQNLLLETQLVVRESSQKTHTRSA